MAVTGPTEPGYLADACAVVAFFSGSGMKTQGEAAMRTGRVAVSSITVWELTRKAALGKLPPLPVAAGGFAGYLQLQGFSPLPLDWPDAEMANSLPPVHRDPMGRMLISQALRRRMTVITEDRLFASYGVATIW